MPAMHYKIWQWGSPDTQGSGEAYNVGLTSRAKRADEHQPFIVANELIALRLGKVLGLPIPDGVIIEREDVPYFASMNFNIEGLNLPPADPTASAREIPSLACGILVFDIWIVNRDRHAKNLHFDKTRKALYLFDHGHALYEHTGFDRLLKNTDSLGIGPHCLAPEISNLMYVEEWVERLFKIPDFYIRESISEGVRVGVPINELSEYAAFLKDRRGKIPGLIKDNRGLFQSAPADLFFAADQLSHGAVDFQI